MTNTSSTISSFIAISLMYRDASNYKNKKTFIHPNSTNIPFDVIKTAIETEIGVDEVVARQWGFENIAPTDHEDLPAGPDDHCYCEITGISEHTADEVKNLTFDDEKVETDISVVMQAIKDGGTKDWFEYDKLVNQAQIKQIHINADAFGLAVTTKEEMKRLTAIAEQAKTRMLPYGVNVNLAAGLASMALSNPSMFKEALENTDFTREDLHKMQAAMAGLLQH